MGKHHEKQEKIETPKSRIKKLFTRKNIIIGLIALLFLIQYFQIQSLLGNFSFLQGRDSSLISEIGTLKESYVNFGTDLNEIRNFLRMPTKNYTGFIEPDEGNVESDKNQDPVKIALSQYVDFLSSNQQKTTFLELNKSYLKSLVNNSEFLTILSEQNLKLSSLTEDDYSVSLKINNPEGLNIVTFYLSKEDAQLYRKTFESKVTVTSKDLASFQAETIKLMEEKAKNLEEKAKSITEKQNQISAAIKSDEVQKIIKDLEISLTSNYTEKDLKATYSVKNKSDEIIGEIVLDFFNLEISLIDKNNESLSLKITDISTALAPFLQKLDTKTFIEKKADEALASLQKTLKDEGFKMLMAQAGFTIAEIPREDEDRVYYDILDKDGKILSSIVIEKFTGVINIVDPNGTNSENLLFFDPDFKKKTLEIPDAIPVFGEELSHGDNTFNILIAGKHGSLVDTMIFAHIDEDRGDIRMISIPRDLFYNGRKINAFAFYYGMPELKKVLSDITGYELDKYILIDMYAFIDVIDLIGGIDIHLDSPVIDPTYRTVDNGVEGTLYYEPGDYHLGGKEALRLARTRHTSSDFARAERQQMILKALQDKAENFGFGDADTIYEIAKTVLSKTETDISLDEVIAYYFRYQNYKIISNDVMSSGNILYVPPYITTENCTKWIEEAAAAGQAKPDCENQNHAYTLLPMNDNWNIIKWFFREKFENML